ncbi:MAG TPA: FecR domain-containing protein [Polyangiaceae bacterium]|jgi:transmembrane sensor|nr:FecR domain-containing protein [Polyangiaceae bacterium]
MRKALVDGMDKVTVQRIWRGIERRRDMSILAGQPRPTLRLVALGAVATTALLAVVIQLGETGAGPLRLVDGSDLAVLTQPPDDPRPFALNDGSNIAIHGDARLEALCNTGRDFVSRLAGGSATFDVRPGGPRHWTVQCGPATVEVDGTRFGVECAGSHARVSVERGVVRVRGEGVRLHTAEAQRTGEVKLTAGDSIEIGGVLPAAPVGTSAGIAPVVAASVGPGAAGAASVGPASAGAVASASAAHVSSSSPEPKDELVLAVSQTAPQGDAVAHLLGVADRARLGGHANDAIAPLGRIVSEHPDDPRAALASFMLGRVELDTLGDPAKAARAFGQAIALGLSRGLLEDAYARLVEARARAGDAEGAHRAAADYAARFPHSARSAAVARWAGGP